ncbi:MAG: serine/threonine-protein kinase [Nitrospiraceae bacterium]
MDMDQAIKTRNPADVASGAGATSRDTHITALPLGHDLHEYRIESVLGSGGFGVTYLAHDTHLNWKVAIKEFFPCNIAVRIQDHSVRPHSPTVAESFQAGLQQFLDEARSLASFRHPNIVRVLRFFEINNTAYMVMEYEQGHPLHQWTGVNGPPDRQGVLSIVRPLLDGLEVVHSAGFLHRDIKPGNILIRTDQSPVLLDFGSARNLTTRSGDTITAIVTPGYAPFEQYHSHGHQGPWSDIYSLGAVMYWMVTGQKPVEAPARVKQDILARAQDIGDPGVYGPTLLKVIDWALTPNEDRRPQSIGELRFALLGEEPRPWPMATPAPVKTVDPDIMTRLENSLVEYVGPLAKLMVKKAAQEADDVRELCRVLAREIMVEEDKRAFLNAVADLWRAPRGGQTSTLVGRSAKRRKVTTKELVEAEKRLADYIGPVAHVLVKKAAVDCPGVRTLYERLAAHLEKPHDRDRFLAILDDAP